MVLDEGISAACLSLAMVLLGPEVMNDMVK